MRFQEVGSPWLHVIGIGEAGRASLSDDAVSELEKADFIVGGQRHLQLAKPFKGEAIIWESPFRSNLAKLDDLRPRKTAMLVTGDPLWFSAGGLILGRYPKDEITCYPQLSAFQLSACRMNWNLSNCRTLTVHGRPHEQAIPFFSPGAQLIILTKDQTSPALIAKLLCQHGYAQSRLTVLAHLGGPDEQMIEGLATDPFDQVPDFHTLCVECIADAGAKPLPVLGLDDDCFEHDGLMTKKEARISALALLAPRPPELLWDLGTGCGSVAIEWCRQHPDLRAYAVDRRQDRLEMAKRNALKLGAARINWACDRIEHVLRDWPDPDAIFIGGGLSLELARAVIKRLKPYGRLLVHAVTLQSQTVLHNLQKELGGSMTRLSVERLEKIGSMSALKPMMPVLTWHWQKTS